MVRMRNDMLTSAWYQGYVRIINHKKLGNRKHERLNLNLQGITAVDSKALGQPYLGPPPQLVVQALEHCLSLLGQFLAGEAQLLTIKVVEG